MYSNNGLCVIDLANVETPKLDAPDVFHCDLVRVIRPCFKTLRDLNDARVFAYTITSRFPSTPVWLSSGYLYFQQKGRFKIFTRK